MARKLKLSGPVEDSQDAAKLIDLIIDGQSPEEQVETLKDILTTHIFEHGWVDEELLVSICDNIGQAYEVEIPESGVNSEDDEEDDEGENDEY